MPARSGTAHLVWSWSSASILAVSLKVTGWTTLEETTSAKADATRNVALMSLTELVSHREMSAVRCLVGALHCGVAFHALHATSITPTAAPAAALMMTLVPEPPSGFSDSSVSSSAASSLLSGAAVLLWPAGLGKDLPAVARESGVSTGAQKPMRDLKGGKGSKASMSHATKAHT
eukprot:3936085-Rhodomonas_salina.1